MHAGEVVRWFTRAESVCIQSMLPLLGLQLHAICSGRHSSQSCLTIGACCTPEAGKSQACMQRCACPSQAAFYGVRWLTLHPDRSSPRRQMATQAPRLNLSVVRLPLLLFARMSRYDCICRHLSHQQPNEYDYVSKANVIRSVNSCSWSPIPQC